MNSTRIERQPPHRRRRKQLLSSGLVLAGFLIGGGIWGASQSVLDPPASLGDATKTGAVPVTETAMPAPPGGATTSTTVPAQAPVSSGTEQAVPPGPTAAAAKSEEELAATPQSTAAPVPINAPATLQPGVTATVAGLEAVAGEASGPGEVAGPAIRFTVTVQNQSAQPVSLERALVHVDGGADKAPALQLSGPGAASFPASVDAGATASAVFVFLLPVDQRDPIDIYLNHQVASPIAAFSGAVTTSEGKS